MRRAVKKQDRQMRRAVILFTRAPVPGQTKTRLMPMISAQGCARLHRCFLSDIEKECRRVKADLYICYTPKDRQNLLYPVFHPGPYHYMPQKGDGLGGRMYRAIRDVLGKGYDSCLLLGTDIPELRAEYVERAFSILEHRDLVLGPTRDGGYYLIGMKVPYEKVFEVKGYGQGSVLSDTVAGLKEAGLTAGFTEPLWDMDTWEDLAGYRRRMRTDRRLQSTDTGRYLAKTCTISVIVPIYNEEKTILSIQDQLEPLRGKCEILLVDGGSTDRTLEFIRPHFKVIHSKKGRALQMNAGAMKSRGDILFFLHCDSELPQRPLAHIRRVMRDHEAGCFGIAFHSWNFFMFTCRVISNHRVKDRKVMFGDQGIFVDRGLFFDAGMFPEIPVMEDYQFSLTLKEMGVRLGMAGRRIYTSHRRFPKGTIPKLKLMWKMNRLRKMYRDHVPIERINEMYRDVR